MTGLTWVDSHGHVHAGESPAAELVARARKAGVRWIMSPGTDLETTLEARKVAEAHRDSVVWSAGLHPHDASRWAEQRGRLEALAVDAWAVGECGLDYYRNLSPPGVQRAAFRDQLELAASLAKPVIVHCRDAFADVYEAVENAGLGAQVILHCWTGGPRWTKRFRDLGVTFSFAGPIAFETGDTVRRGAAEAPPGRTMVETDTPYLAPPPHRGQANEPAYVPLVGAALASVWGFTVEETARLTTETACRVFGLGSA